MARSIADDITVMILTYNEEENIRRTLLALQWARDILIIDSGSKDRTLEIAAQFKQVRVVHRPFDDFAAQCNAGLSHISRPWVLSLDADYELSSDVSREIETLEPGDISGFRCRFIYRLYGHALHASLYPPRTVLYRCERARYVNEGHGHRVVIAGLVRNLEGVIYHDDRKPLARWLASQQKYAAHEADYLLASDRAKLRGVDRIRLTGWLAPIGVFFYTLIWKRCLIEGWPGWLYVLQRVVAEIMIALEIVDRRVRCSKSETASRPDTLQ